MKMNTHTQTRSKKANELNFLLYFKMSINNILKNEHLGKEKTNKQTKLAIIN